MHHTSWRLTPRLAAIALAGVLGLGLALSTFGGEACTKARDACALEGISALDPADRSLWTKRGPPRVDALRRASGVADLTGEERDAAWAAWPEFEAERRVRAELEGRAEAAEAAAERARADLDRLERSLAAATDARDRYRLELRASQGKVRESRAAIEGLRSRLGALERGDSRGPAEQLVACLEVGR